MFRPMRRIKNEISEEAAKELLVNEKRGILAVNGDDGYPYAIPVDYYYDSECNKIFFHGAKSGHKVDALKRDDKVCFTVYGNEKKVDGEWAPYLQSTVVFGRCELIDDPEITSYRVRQFAMKYYPSASEVEAEMNIIHRTQLYEITIEHISGKQIQEK